MESKFIKYQKKYIHYKVVGKGKAVIFLHGFGEDGNIWTELITDFKNDYLLIVPDIPGSGQSEMLNEENIIPTRRQVSIADYAEVIKGILDKEFIRECTIIGHSLGGYITLAFAKKYPEMLDNFAFFSLLYHSHMACF